MKFGLLGAGWYGREAHLRNLIRLPDVEVVAVSSRSAESLSAASEIVGPAMRMYRDWRQVLAIEEIDAIIIALPNDHHHEAAMAAFAAGKHVLCEKPLGLTLAQCDEVIVAAAEAGRILQVGHEMRFQKLYAIMHQMIAAGDVGDPQLMWCREFRGPMRAGWRSSEAITGGTILEKCVHHIDLFNWMIDRPPLRVSAHGGTNVLTDREILDNAQVLIEYEGGRRASLELCLFAPQGGDCEFGVCGAGGRIDTRNQALSLSLQRFDGSPAESSVVREPDDAANFVDGSGRVDRGIGAQLEHFIHCIREGRKPLNDGLAARCAIQVCLAAQESIRRKQSVTFAEMN